MAFISVLFTFLFLFSCVSLKRILVPIFVIIIFCLNALSIDTMNLEEESLNFISNGLPEPLLECRLCGQSSNSCVDLSAISDIIPLSFIHKNIGIKLKLNDISPNFICKQCTIKITDWQKFVRSCTEAQSVVKERWDMTQIPLTYKILNHYSFLQAKLQQRFWTYPSKWETTTSGCRRNNSSESDRSEWLSGREQPSVSFR